MQRFNLFFIFFTVFASACNISGPSDQTSEVSGKVPTRATRIDMPEPAPQEVLENFGKRIRASIPLASVSTASTPAQKRLGLTSAYIKTLADVAYIPRKQGQKIIENLVSESSTACGGGSCARVFGIKPQETDDFFNHTLAEVGSSKTLAESAKSEQKKRLIGALTPESDGSKTKQVWQDLADLYLTSPRILPSLVAQPQTIPSYNQVENLLGSRFTSSVNDYTRSHDTLRRVEISSDEDLMQSGYNLPTIGRHRQTIRVINDGLSRLPATNQAVYRGMNNVTPEDMSVFINKWKTKTSTHLGPNGMAALTSASWDLKVAKDFAFMYKGSDGPPKFFVIMVLRNHRGVPIQNLSEFPTEHEVLIPSSQKFIIENMAPILNEPLGFIMYLRGVNEAAQRNLNRLQEKLVA